MALTGVAGIQQVTGFGATVITTGIAAAPGDVMVLMVETPDTITITSITDQINNPVNTVLRGTHTANGHKIWVYDELITSVVSNGYKVTFSPGVPATNPRDWVFAYCYKFHSNTQSGIRAIAFTDGGTAPSLVLPSVSATKPDDLLAMVWAAGNPLNGFPDTPPGMTFRGNSGSSPPWFRTGVWSEVWQSSLATGTRTTSDASIPQESWLYSLGVMMLIGQSGPLVAPPLRQRQRDDGLANSAPRQAGVSLNPPTSKQRSNRQGWTNTYL